MQGLEVWSRPPLTPNTQPSSLLAEASCRCGEARTVVAGVARALDHLEPREKPISSQSPGSAGVMASG